MKKIVYTLSIIVSLLFTGNVFATYTISTFDYNWCSATYPTAFVTGSFSITETSYSANNGNDGLTKNQTNKTLQISLPSGFEFNTSGSAASVTASGTEITINSFSFTSSTTFVVNLSTASTNVEYNTIFFKNFQVRATASGASGNMTRTGGNFKIDNSSANPTSLQPFGVFSSQTPFTYVKSAVAQPDLSNIKQYSIDNDILQIEVIGTGSCGVPLTQFTFSTNGNNGTGTDTTYNITTAKIYYTGSSSTFSTSTFFGSVSSPSGTFVITGSTTLANGNNFFWLTYDVPGDAYTDSHHDKLDATLISFVINGVTKTDMTTPSPVGYRTVIPAAFYYSRSTGNWSDATLWTTAYKGPACSCVPNGGGVVEIDSSHVVNMNTSRTVDGVIINQGGSLKGANASLVFTVNSSVTTYGNGFFSFPGDIAVAGNVTLNGTGSSAWQKNFSIGGDLSIASGASLVNSTSSSLDLIIGGNLTVYGSLQDAATNNIDLTGGFGYIDGTGSITNANSVIIKNGNKTVKSTANLYIGTGFSIQGNYILDNFGTVNITGNMDATAASAEWINETNSYLSYGGSAQMFVTYGILDALASFNTVNYSGLTSQGIIIPESAQYYNLILSGSGTKTQLSNLSIYGDLTTNAAYSHNGTAITFEGSVMQNVYGTVTPTLHDMIMLNSGAGLTLHEPVFVDDKLTLTTGIVYTTLTNILTVKLNATSTSGSANSFVSGPMKKVGNNAFVFPVGKSTYWARIGISAPQTTTSEFIAEYFANAYTNVTPVTAPLDHISHVEYWNLLRNVGSDSVKIQLYWESAARSGINSYSSSLVVAGWTGTAWVNRGQSAITASDPGNVTSNVDHVFGPVTFGSQSNKVNPLPIVLLSYTATYANGKVDIAWSTASETNNDYFSIERTSDLNNITVVGIVAGAGNSNTTLYYSYTDNDPGVGMVYYRIRQTDYDGKTSASPWMTVKIPLTSNITFITDNSSGNLTINFNNDNSGYDINIYDLAGNIVAKSSKSENGNNSVVVSLSGKSKGIYIVRVSSVANTVTKKIVLG